MSVAFAFIVGLITFIDPCVIAMVPVYLTYLSGRRVADGSAGEPATRWTLVGRTGFFVAGFSTLFVAIWALVVALGQAVGHIIPWMYNVGAIVTILIGLALICGVVRPLDRVANWIPRVTRAATSPGGAYVLGLSLGVAWIPCVGPIMAAVVLLAGLTQQVTNGLALVLAYNAGLAIPFVLAAFGVAGLLRRVRNLRTVLRAGTAAAGVGMVLIGVLVFTHGYEAIEHYVEEFYEHTVPGLYGWRDEVQYEEWWETWFGKSAK
jgi:cytochrome c-type biogenesis protein